MNKFSQFKKSQAIRPVDLLIVSKREIFSSNQYFKNYDKPNKENRRISSEVKKVFISCQIIVFVLDVRNPLGTWPSFLNHKNKYKSKKILIILNKCDLVPFWVLEKWIKIFSRNFLVLGFFCKRKNESGRKKILCILKQIKKKFFSEKKKIFIGIIGYPNVGKSSFINILIGKNCLKASCIPGQTKVWQFVKLWKDIFLIDSPGILTDENLSKDLHILKGTTRAEKLKTFDSKVISTIVKMIGTRKTNSLKFLDKNRSTNDHFLYSDCSLGKGGKKNDLVSKNKTIKSFITGTLPWYSPIPNSTFDIVNPLKIIIWKNIIPYV
jgi:nuclear GTP-binding protein|mmetsp:Transcript_13237/g.20974  ORF Transcript_13237/g.20974 Transcript_13237/m.20974 type:complete len:323 (+) Transcript_13237:20-988(+)